MQARLHSINLSGMLCYVGTLERKNGVYSYSVECHHFAAFPTVFTPTLSNLPMGVSRFNEIKPRYSS